MSTNLEQMSVNAIRVLAADAVQKANSGHPGLPLGCAAIGYELWGNHMNHNPANPQWADRDRFILSGGHGSTLLYSLLHLFGYGLTKEDLMNFRQLDSLTPGHPEYGHTVGVEATTGPLGAGMGMAVGMAAAEAHLAAIFNKEGYPVVNHYTYVLGGDGCMMEGISSEAMSLAGTLKLNKLIVIYDSNSISIEGSTNITFTENVQKRFESFGFQTITVEDGNDIEEIGAAIEAAKADTTRPSLITVKTKSVLDVLQRKEKQVPTENLLGLIMWQNSEKPLTGHRMKVSMYLMKYMKITKNLLRRVQKRSRVECSFEEYCTKYPEMKNYGILILIKPC